MGRNSSVKPFCCAFNDSYTLIVVCSVILLKYIFLNEEHKNHAFSKCIDFFQSFAINTFINLLVKCSVNVD